MTNRDLKGYGLSVGAYDGAHKRRFVLFEDDPTSGNVWRREFDTKRERDLAAHVARDRIAFARRTKP